jgi:hypothetical protein
MFSQFRTYMNNEIVDSFVTLSSGALQAGAIVPVKLQGCNEAGRVVRPSGHGATKGL